jgi:hypothetical protein
MIPDQVWSIGIPNGSDSMRIVDSMNHGDADPFESVTFFFPRISANDSMNFPGLRPSLIAGNSCCRIRLGNHDAHFLAMSGGRSPQKMDVVPIRGDSRAKKPRPFTPSACCHISAT